jgi:hypothetical protein
MFQRSMVVALTFLACALASTPALAHERSYEFDGTHIALSVERFTGVDFVDFEGPGGDSLSAHILLNASEPVPTSYARLGFDVFIHRLSIGLAGGFTTEDVAVLAPRVGYLFGLTPTLGLWLRVGGFYAATRGPNYAGLTAEALLGWFPYSNIALTFGPTLDLAFATGERDLNYVALGIPQIGMTVFL